MKLQVAADWVQAPLQAFVNEARAEIAVLLHSSGQVLGQYGFAKSVDVVTACALAAAIHASSGALGKLVDGTPFRGMHYAGTAKQIFIGPVPTEGSMLLLLTVFDEESSLGLVQIFFKEFAASVAKVAPKLGGAEKALATDFEAELNKNLAAMFGRG